MKQVPMTDEQIGACRALILAGGRAIGTEDSFLISAQLILMFRQAQSNEPVEVKKDGEV